MISALIFPETTVSPPDTAKFLLFFDKLAFYLATEPEETEPNTGGLLADLRIIGCNKPWMPDGERAALHEGSASFDRSGIP